MQKQHNSSKIIKISSAVVLLAVLLGIGLVIFHKNYSAPKTKNQKPALSYSTKPAPAADNNQSQQTKIGKTTSPGSSSQSNTTKTNNASFSDKIVSYVVSNNNLHIGTFVSGTTTGNCLLTASKQGQSNLTLGSSKVRLDVNNYDCGVFNISTSKFPVRSVWKITLSVTNNGETATNSVYVTI